MTRELDAEVAEKVMGWKRHHRNTIYWVDAADEFAVCDYVRAVVGEWRPSTDLNAAMQAVRKVYELGNAAQEAFATALCRELHIRLCDYATNLTLALAFHDMTAEAICRAALAAVEASK